MSNRSRLFQVERLESREMLDASVQIADGVLQIFGDDGDNRFLIGNADRGGIRVRGPGVNGQTFGQLDFSKGDFRSIDVRLFEGNNSITFEHIELNQSIRIRGGSGTDVVRFSGTSNHFVKDIPRVTFIGLDGRDDFGAKDSWFDQLTVNFGDGSKSVRLDKVTVQRETSIFMGSGGDDIIFESSEFRRFVKIDTGTGGRFAQMDANRFLGSLRVTNIEKQDNASQSFRFRENQVGRDINVRLGDGPDYALIRGNHIEGRLRVSGDRSVTSPGGGDDEILVYNNLIRGDVSINTGVGDDQVHVRGTDSNEFVLRTHAGNDKVLVQRVDVAMALLTLGTENDSCLIEYSDIEGSLTISGQRGEDYIYGYANSIGGVSSLAGGAGNDRLFMVLSEVFGDANLLGQDEDDEITAFNNSFLSDVDVFGGDGLDGYSAGVAAGVETNFVAGLLDKQTNDDIAAPDFRAIRQTLGTL